MGGGDSRERYFNNADMSNVKWSKNSLAPLSSKCSSRFLIVSNKVSNQRSEG